MVFPLLRLPPEVLYTHLLPVLEPADLVSLWKCVHFEVSKAVYCRVFPCDPPQQHYDNELFGRRIGAKLCMIGGLSEDWKDADADIEVVHFPEFDQYRLCSFLQIDSGEIPIVQFHTCGGYGFQARAVVTLDVHRDLRVMFETADDGTMFGVCPMETVVDEKGDDFEALRFEHSASRESHDDVIKLAIEASRTRYELGQAVGSAPEVLRAAKKAALRAYWNHYKALLRENQDKEDPRIPWEHMEERYALVEEQALADPAFEIDNHFQNVTFTESAELGWASADFFGQLKMGTREIPKFCDFCPELDMWAADQSGTLWSWPLHVHGKEGAGYVPASLQGVQAGQGFPLLLQEHHTGELLPQRAQMVRSSQSRNSCFVQGRGIAVYCGPTCTETALPNGFRAGVRCCDDHMCALHVHTVPETALGVKDYVLEDPCGIIVLRHDGRVQRSARFSAPQYLDSVNELGRFVQVSASRKVLAAVTTDGRVVVARLSSGIDPEEPLVEEAHVVEALEGVRVVQVSRGGVHFLALSDKGEVYVWGVEEYLCGSLGLGRLAEARKRSDVIVDDEEMRLAKPVKMKVAGHVFGVEAGRCISLLLVG